MTTIVQTPLAILAPITASATVAAGKHTPVDATAGPLTATLPAPPRVGARLRVEKTDTSANAVTVAGTIRGASTTIALQLPSQVIELVAETPSSWRPVASHKTLASLLAYFTAAFSSLFASTTDARFSGLPINAQTGTAYTLVAADAGKVVEMTNASANTLTVPPNSAVAFPVGTVIEVDQVGTGQTTIAAGSGVTLRAPDGARLSGQYRAVTLRQRATDEWILAGAVTS